MKIKLPEMSLVLLIGPSGAGKSTFAKKHFLPSEVLSSDVFRGLVSDDENDQSASNDAFDVLHYLLRIRLKRGLLTVLDATNVRPEDRKQVIALARAYHVLPTAIVFDIDPKICNERNKDRENRNFGYRVVHGHYKAMKRGIRGLKREGFRNITFLNSVEDVDSAEISRQPLWNNKKELHGPFDIIGDVHGCIDELRGLLTKLGYQVDGTLGEGVFADEPLWRHPEGRTALFLGDLNDRGPASVPCLKLAYAMVKGGTGLAVPGNHEEKLIKKMMGKKVNLKHGLEGTWNEFEALPGGADGEQAKELHAFMQGLVSHLVLDDGKLVVAHAGMREDMAGRGSSKVRSFALWGETTGEIDEFGLPVRHNWAAEYRGDAAVVYGHTPVPKAEWLNNTICIDTGCCFGGKLSALRWPEREIVEVEAAEIYCEPVRPIEASPLALSLQAAADDVLDAQDVLGKRIVDTRLRPRITVREENALAALEIMSRFAVNPRWLAYLPPTMSPCATSERDSYLEYPEQAFNYFRKEGVEQVICEEKHMGSRAVVVLCRDADTAKERFGVNTGESGIIYTRTGRRFFNKREVEYALIDRLRKAADQAGLWARHESDWFIFDAELMPWSEKAQALLHTQYAPVGAAARAVMPPVNEALRAAKERGIDFAGLDERMSEREESLKAYVEAYRHYCWKVETLDDLKLAPFHLLASEGHTHLEKPHTWHMDEIARWCAEDEAILLATPYKVVNVQEQASVEAATDWWLEMTGKGGEGMVVKPMEFIAKGQRGFAQPAVKVRGPEYLRIIYGPDYDAPHNIDRLRKRGLGRKRSMADREFALGVEGLERFVAREPLRRVHECVFGVLAMESEPVDPRL